MFLSNQALRKPAVFDQVTCIETFSANLFISKKGANKEIMYENHFDDFFHDLFT